MRTTPFQPDHIARLDIQPHQAWSRDLMLSGYAERYAAGPVAQTVWDGDTPIACLGAVELWSGNLECWSVIGGNLGTRFLWVDRAARELLANTAARRFQAYVDATFSPGVRWMLDLRFKVEGKLAGYFPNGNDAFLFALTHTATQPFSMIESYDEPGMLAKILRLESEMALLPQSDIEPVHRFSHGIYWREITIPAGTLLTGKMHRTDHMSVVLRGDISVLTENGIERIKAPAVVPACAGMKRVGYAHEETVWITAHGTHETDLVKLEAELIQQPMLEAR